MPDGAKSWASFKLSWFRRMTTSQGTWIKIFLKNLTEAHGEPIENIWSFLETKSHIVAKKIKNPFWRESLAVLETFRREYIKRFPEEIIYSTIWGSSSFKRGNRRLFRLEFPSISNHINTTHDLVIPDNAGNCRLMDWDEFRILERGAIFDFNEFLSLKLAISQTLTSTGINLNQLEYKSPARPVLFSLLTMSSKGCNKWNKIKTPIAQSKSILDREEKWNNSLGSIQGIFFWDKCYLNNKKIDFNNRIRWLQYQIVRGTLKTNRIISKFSANTTSQCTLCNDDTETILHLFWDCIHVQIFIREVKTKINENNLPVLFNHNRKSFIFNTNGKITDRNNIFALFMKLYIWKVRCKGSILSSNLFIDFFKSEIHILRHAFQHIDVLFDT